jgi:hypothetical protein
MSIQEVGISGGAAGQVVNAGFLDLTYGDKPIMSIGLME